MTENTKLLFYIPYMNHRTALPHFILTVFFFLQKTSSGVFRFECETFSCPFCPFCLTEGTAGLDETFLHHQPFLLAAICNQIVSMSTQSVGLP